MTDRNLTKTLSVMMISEKLVDNYKIIGLIICITIACIVALLCNRRIKITVMYDRILIKVRPRMNIAERTMNTNGTTVVVIICIICIAITCIVAMLTNHGMQLSVMPDRILTDLPTAKITAASTLNMMEIIVLVTCIAITFIVAMSRNHGIEYAVQRDRVIIDFIPREEIPDIIT